MEFCARESVDLDLHHSSIILIKSWIWFVIYHLGSGFSGRLQTVMLQQLCSEKRREIRRLKFEGCVDDQVMEILDKQGNELKQAQQVIPSLQKQVTSLTQQLHYLAQGLAERAVLEPAMEGKDIIGRARIGTGKMLAFGVPILNKILQHNEKHGAGIHPLALVLAPTRELARQVDRECEVSY